MNWKHLLSSLDRFELKTICDQFCISIHRRRIRKKFFLQTCVKCFVHWDWQGMTWHDVTPCKCSWWYTIQWPSLPSVSSFRNERSSTLPIIIQLCPWRNIGSSSSSSIVPFFSPPLRRMQCSKWHLSGSQPPLHIFRNQSHHHLWQQLGSHSKSGCHREWVGNAWTLVRCSFSSRRQESSSAGITISLEAPLLIVWCSVGVALLESNLAGTLKRCGSSGGGAAVVYLTRYHDDGAGKDGDKITAHCLCTTYLSSRKRL